MKVADQEARDYEVRCYSCDTSFAAGTRRCIHCGERITRHVPLDGPLERLDRMANGEVVDEEEVELPASPGRALIWVISAIVALVGSALRACQGG